MLSRHNVGTYQVNELTRSQSENTRPQSSQLASTLWTHDRGFHLHTTSICPLTKRIVGVPKITSQPVSSIFFSLFSTALWDLANSKLVHSLTLSSHLFFCLSCLLTQFAVLQVGFGQACRTADMFIRLQLASLYDGHEVFVWSDCLLDLGTDFLVGNMVVVRDEQYFAVARYISFPWLVFFFAALL